MSGHVFVVNGTIEELVHDAAVVPTDAFFTVERHWAKLLGQPAGELEPPEWVGGGWGRASDGRDVWFIDVGDGPEIGALGLAKRLRGLLDEMARADLSKSPGRVLPLIALPVLAIGEGGLNSQRGEVIVELLRVLTDFVNGHDIDVAVVTPDRSVFAAVQHQRGRREGGWTLDDVGLSEAHRLGELARTGQLALMIGAGASVPAGMPSWGELVKGVGEALGVPYERISRLDALDQAELLSRRSDGALGELVARVMQREEARPSLAHVLLAGLRCREALTTNYDDFYERAMSAATRREPKLGVVPATVGAPADRWLLKMHGSLEDVDSIVLTRRQFVQYDARVKPAASVLQSLALTRHLLMVGLSMRDDNVVRLLHEVDAYRRQSGQGATSRPFATLLNVSEDPARAELWEGQVTWLRMGEGRLPQSGRDLEIFLDAVSAFACEDATWLLDERFEGMLSDRERSLAERARELLRDVEMSTVASEGWGRLAAALRGFGAG